MGFRFRRSVRLGKGVRLNFSKRGLGLSFGVRGARWSIGPSGARASLGIPGTGIYYTQRLGAGKREKTAPLLDGLTSSQVETSPSVKPARTGRPWVWVVIGILAWLWTAYVGVPLVIYGLYLWGRTLAASHRPPIESTPMEPEPTTLTSDMVVDLDTVADDTTEPEEGAVVYRVGGMGPDSQRYYHLLSKIEYSRAMRKYREALDLSLEALQYLPGLVRETVDQFGKWDIVSVPPVHYACKYLSVLGREDDLANVKTVVSRIPELNDWVGVVDRSLEETKLMRRVYDFLRSNPGFPQNKLGRALTADGRVIANLIVYAEQIGMLRRERDGRTYRVFLTEQVTEGS